MVASVGGNETEHRYVPSRLILSHLTVGTWEAMQGRRRTALQGRLNSSQEPFSPDKACLKNTYGRTLASMMMKISVFELDLPESKIIAWSGHGII